VTQVLHRISGFSSLITSDPLAPIFFTHSSLAATGLCIQCAFYCLLSLLFYLLIEKIRQSIYLVQSSLLYFLSAMENILVFLMTSVFPFCSGRFYLPWFYRGKKGDRNCTTGAKFSNIVAFLYLCKHPLCTGMTYLSMEQGTHRALCACASTASLTLKDTAEQLHVTFQGQTRGTLQAWAQR